MTDVAVMEEDHWTEVAGLTVTVTTTRAQQKVLLAAWLPKGCFIGCFATRAWKADWLVVVLGLFRGGGGKRGAIACWHIPVHLQR